MCYLSNSMCITSAIQCVLPQQFNVYYLSNSMCVTSAIQCVLPQQFNVCYLSNSMCITSAIQCVLPQQFNVLPQQFNDVWLLSMDTDIWSWSQLQVNNPENGAPQLWCHPACKVSYPLSTSLHVIKIYSIKNTTFRKKVLLIETFS